MPLSRSARPSPHSQVGAQHHLGVAVGVGTVPARAQLLAQLDEVVDLAAVDEHDGARRRRPPHRLPPPVRSMIASRRCPSAACRVDPDAPASGPRQAIVSVIASSVARSRLRSRWKTTHPVMPHMRPCSAPRGPTQGATRPPVPHGVSQGECEHVSFGPASWKTGLDLDAAPPRWYQRRGPFPIPEGAMSNAQAPVENVSGPVFRLIYRSHSRIGEAARTTELDRSSPRHGRTTSDSA